MKLNLIVLISIIGLSTFDAIGVTPVHVGKVRVDTSKYEKADWGFTYFTIGPKVPLTMTDSPLSGNVEILVREYLRKNSNVFDLYSYNGLVGSTVVPVPKEEIFRLRFSRYIVDEDDGWEALVTRYNQTTGNSRFQLFDEDGTELLADSGNAYYGFDGNSTYVFAYLGYSVDLFDSWRFRTNLSSESQKTLAKTKSIQSSPMQIYGLPGGDYRVTLTPSSGNQINFQMFDLLGRCVFDKQIENLNRPVSFTVQEGNVPNSPFIAKVNDGNNSVVKKQIPVK